MHRKKYRDKLNLKLKQTTNDKTDNTLRYKNDND